MLAVLCKSYPTHLPALLTKGHDELSLVFVKQALFGQKATEQWGTG